MAEGQCPHNTRAGALEPLDGGRGRTLGRRAGRVPQEIFNETQRFEEARPILRKTIPVSRRALGEGHRLTLKIRSLYAQTLYLDAGATLDDLHEATTTLEETERTARRVFGGAHPIIRAIETNLKNLRGVLRARETPSPR